MGDLPKPCWERIRRFSVDWMRCVQTDDANAARFGFVRVRNRQVGVVRRTAVRNDDRRVRYVRSVAIGDVEHLRHHDVESSRRVGVGVEKPQSVQRTLLTFKIRNTATPAYLNRHNTVT